jgi:hypothetical protein
MSSKSGRPPNEPGEGRIKKSIMFDKYTWQNFVMRGKIIDESPNAIAGAACDKDAADNPVEEEIAKEKAYHKTKLADLEKIEQLYLDNKNHSISKAKYMCLAFIENNLRELMKDKNREEKISEKIEEISRNLNLPYEDVKAAYLEAVEMYKKRQEENLNKSEQLPEETT